MLTSRELQWCACPLTPEAVKKVNGRDALLRVRDGKPNTDAEHRVPTESGLQTQTNFFTAPRWGEGSRTADEHSSLIRLDLARFATETRAWLCGDSLTFRRLCST